MLKITISRFVLHSFKADTVASIQAVNETRIGLQSTRQYMIVKENLHFKCKIIFTN